MTLINECFATWFDSGEFTMFWRELQYVAYVPFLFAEIFICAIFHAFSISGRPVDCLNWIDGVGHCNSHSFFFFAKGEDQSSKPVIRPIPLNYILILMLCYTSHKLYNVQCSVHIQGPVAFCAGNCNG